MRVEDDRERRPPLARAIDRGAHEVGAEPGPACRHRRGDAADAGSRIRTAVVKQPQRCKNLTVVAFDPQQLGVGLEVTAVEFGVGGLLLDHEDLDSQPQEPVESLGGDVAQRSTVRSRHRIRVVRPAEHDVGEGPGSAEAKYIDWLTISDQASSVTEDVARIKAHLLVPARIAVYGYIYDVTTGRLVEVPTATDAGRPTASRRSSTRVDPEQSGETGRVGGDSLRHADRRLDRALV